MNARRKPRRKSRQLPRCTACGGVSVLVDTPHGKVRRDYLGADGKHPSCR